MNGLKSLPFLNVILVLGKARSHRVPNLGCRGLSPLEDLMFWENTLHEMWGMSGAWAGALSWWSCQSPTAHSCGLLNHPSGFREECSSLMQNLIQIHWSTQSFWMTATQYTCSLNNTYWPHWLVQWRCHCSCLCVPVLSSWLPGYLVATWAQLNQNLPRNSMSAFRFQSVLIWVPLNAEPDTISLVQFCYPLFTTKILTLFYGKLQEVFHGCSVRSISVVHRITLSHALCYVLFFQELKA